MTKPEDIAQWAWDKADPVMKWIDAFWADELSESEKSEAKECIASAILSAAQEEREACAKAAEWYADTNSEYLPEEIVIACGQTAADIASAIRNRKES